MPSKAVLRYFDATENRPTRADLKLAVTLVKGNKVAIDCGCGAGSDIAFLRKEGFLVHAFDIEPASIARCNKRFSNDEEVLLTQASFSSFSYPHAALVVADASLFFCPEQEFEAVWRKITNALSTDGVFAGSFLGPQDRMAGPGYDKDAYWSDILVLSEEKVKNLFKGYHIKSFVEHRVSGETIEGEPHQWHIFSIVAQKKPNSTCQATTSNAHL